jgi:transcriptional regulator with XRE-family HTH domain
MDQQALGDYIKREREAQGLSLRKLAAHAKVDYSWLSRLERGVYSSPDARSLSRVSRALDIEVADLYLQAGYGDGQGLPGFAPYLRAKYDLPDDALAQLQAHFELLNEKYRQDKDGAA